MVTKVIENFSVDPGEWEIKRHCSAEKTIKNDIEEQISRIETKDREERERRN